MYGAGEFMGVLGIVAFFGAVIFGIIGASHQSLRGFVGVAGCMFVASVILIMSGASASVPSCTAPVGSKIQWRKDSSVATGEGGSLHYHYSYLEMDDGTYCLVEDRALYDMGIGYRTKQEYTGKVVTQP